MTRRAFRFLLLAAYGLLLGAMVTAIVLFTASVNRHIGSDYTAAASNIVRGQAEASKLRHMAELYLAYPHEGLRDRLLRTLDTIESREGTTRNAFDHLGLAGDTRDAVVAEFERVLELLPRARTLTRRALDDPAAREAFRETARALENSLAFVYSSLHRRNHAAAAEQERITGWLTAALVALAVVLLVIIAALLWAVDKVHGQNTALGRLTVTDILTELPNRRGLLQRFEQAVAQHRRNGRPLSLALLDLDHFKTINDSAGHPAGDAVLQYLAREITRVIRASDMLARIGGEEFGLLMPETGVEGAHELCERIRRHIEQTELPMVDAIDYLTLSIGLVTIHVDAETSFDRLYVEADRALYEAKRQGRNRTVTHTP